MPFPRSDHEQTSNGTQKAHSCKVHLHWAGSTVRLSSGAGGTRSSRCRRASLSTSFSKGTTADISTLNNSVGVIRVEGAAIKCRGRLHVKSTLDIGQSWQRDIGEATREIKGAADSLQLGEAINNLQLGVVGNLVATTDNCKLRNGDVCQLRIVVKHKSITDESQVSSTEGLESVGISAERTSDVGKRWDEELADISERQVGGSQQIRKFNAKSWRVRSDCQVAGDCLQVVDVEIRKIWVVGNFESSNSAQLDTSQAVKLGVYDADTCCRLDTCSEIESLQVGKTNEVDNVDLGQAVHLEIGQDSDLLQMEIAANCCELVR